MGYRITCPHCSNVSKIRSSREVSEISREIYVRCNNIECGHTWVVIASAARTIVPSQTPNPKVHIPMGALAPAGGTG